MPQRQKNNRKTSRSQLFSFMPDCYLDRTSRPIYALAYLLAFIIFYEIGIFIVNPLILEQSLEQQHSVVVSFVWIQSMLKFLRFSDRMTWLVTPLVVVLILLALQITSRTSWRVRIKDFIPMTIECILLAVPLIVLILIFNHSAADPQPGATANQAVSANAQAGLLPEIVTGIGAGIYEELIFRLILICLLMLLLEDYLLFSRKSSVIFSVLIAAVLFSLHHHIHFVHGQFQAGEPFYFAPFVFRILAGIYFAILFAVRGFAITAGTHVFYDIIAALLNALLFAPGD